MHQRRWPYLISGILVVFALALLLNYLSFRRAFTRWQDDPPARGQRIMIDGAELFYTLRGEGEILIVTEGGLGTLSEKWEPLADQLARYGKVLTYERGGYGYSRTTNTPRDGETISRELAQLLDAIEWDGPVLYIGHSFGAEQILQHALIIDRPVVGVVMVDPGPADTQAVWHALLADDRLSNRAHRLVRAVESQTTLLATRSVGVMGLLYRLYLLQGGTPDGEYYAVIMNASSPAYYRALIDEMELVRTVYTPQEEAALAEIPLVLITNNPAEVHTELVEDYGLSDDEATIMADALQNGKLAYLDLSPQSSLLIAETGDHDIYLVEPEIVLQAVESLIGE